MKRQLVKPDQVPKRGYYYHYKHDPKGPVNNYAYYIFGVGVHTEDDCRPEDQFQMGYQPLYESPVYELGPEFYDNRPLGMFYEPPDDNAPEKQRYARIEDSAIIAQLRAIRDRMYPDEE